MTRPLPIKVRITAALASGPVEYHALMRAVFPPDEYPRAYHSSHNGGPPGCAFALGRAIREMGCADYGDRAGRRMIALPQSM